MVPYNGVMNTNATKSETKKNRSTSLKDMKVGESVVGYILGFFKAKNSKSPDVNNLILRLKDSNEEIAMFASGTLRYFEDRMEQKGAALGTLVKITRIDRPANSKVENQKYFADIGFKLDDVLPETELKKAGRSDKDGFEF